MGQLDRFRSRPSPPANSRWRDTPSAITVGALHDMPNVSATFADRNITFGGSLSGYNYEAILRDKQRHIYQLYELSDYYVDADPIYRGIIKEVYTPFSICDDFKLIGANEKVKKKYLDYYERIHLRDLMASIFLQYYKYGNVFIYLMEDGTMITLPVHYVRIGNVTINGEPIVEMNCRQIRYEQEMTYGSTQKSWVKDDELKVRLQGQPPEIGQGIDANKEYVQLNPANVFVLQDLHEDWIRYAVPMIASCLKPLGKKERISTYEDALIDLAARSFVHVKYGDPRNEVLPDKTALTQVNNLFYQAMTGTALATTNNWCEAEVVQPKTDDMFEYDKYKGVNADILSAGGISAVIVSGRSDDGSTFASAQVSMQTAAMRIKQAKDQFCDMMNKINRRQNTNSTMPHSAEDQIPRFTFPPVDLSGSKAFQDACLKLYDKGVISRETLLQTYGYDKGQEFERKRLEKQQGVDTVLSPDETTAKEESTDETIGRPTLDDSERHSDPSKSVTGRQPKGSNPEGSTPQT